MLQDPYVLDQAGRAVVLAAIRRHCAHRGWNLLAAHVRSNHVHAVVEAEARPERIMNEFKSYASRELNLLGSDGPDRKRGRGMEAPVGCGRTTMYGMLFSRWSTSRASPWHCSSQMSFEEMQLSAPLRSRLGIRRARYETFTRLHFYVAHPLVQRLARWRRNAERLQ